MGGATHLKRCEKSFASEEGRMTRPNQRDLGMAKCVSIATAISTSIL